MSSLINIDLIKSFHVFCGPGFYIFIFHRLVFSDQFMLETALTSRVYIIIVKKKKKNLCHVYAHHLYLRDSDNMNSHTFNAFQFEVQIMSCICTFPTMTSPGGCCEKDVQKLTDKIQESECDQQVGNPVEAAGECKCPSSDLSWKYFTQEKPGHWSKKKKNNNNPKHFQFEFTQKWKFSHYWLSPVLMESQVKFLHTQKTTEVAHDFFLAKILMCPPSEVDLCLLKVTSFQISLGFWDFC